jgi:hypothetical protein
LILSGSYKHYLYGTDENFDDNVDIKKLHPVLMREEKPGVTYALHHTMIHSIVAKPYTVSMVLRGPAVKERFIVSDKQTNKSWWQYGAQVESLEERQKKAMSLYRLNESIELIKEIGII